jgi:hypothetical protein
MNLQEINYCKVIPNIISPFLCKEIIEKFENAPNKYVGECGGGRNTNIKRTLDFNIPFNKGSNQWHDEDYNDWKNISEALKMTLSHQIGIYLHEIERYINNKNNKNNTVHVYKALDNSMHFRDLLMHKYFKSEGIFDYHSDDMVVFDNHEYRALTYIFYLNDVNIGGETEVINNGLIKPKQGNLLLFPACWTFPHKGHPPVSEDKYIITGWTFLNV